MTSLDIAAAVRLYAESHPRPPHVTQAQARRDTAPVAASRINKPRVISSSPPLPSCA